MDYDKKLFLIDGNSRRRAAICYMLAQEEAWWDHGEHGHIHAEPFENVREFILRWPRVGTILIEDADDNITHLLNTMALHGVSRPVLSYSEHPSTHRVVEALHEGVIDYLEWPFCSEDIATVLRVIESGAEKTPGLKMRDEQARDRVQKLTKREREVLAGVAGGLSNRVLGEHMSISPRTVEAHRANMLHKMGVHCTADAIRIAIEAEII